MLMSICNKTQLQAARERGGLSGAVPKRVRVRLGELAELMAGYENCQLRYATTKFSPSFLKLDSWGGRQSFGGTTQGFGCAVGGKGVTWSVASPFLSFLKVRNGGDMGKGRGMDVMSNIFPCSLQQILFFEWGFFIGVEKLSVGVT